MTSEEFKKLVVGRTIVDVRAWDDDYDHSVTELTLLLDNGAEVVISWTTDGVASAEYWSEERRKKADADWKARNQQ